MTADIKPLVTSVKQTYVTNSNAYKQSLYGNSRLNAVGLKPSSTGTSGSTNRIRSAFFAEQNSHLGKDQAGASNGYARFRPVTSHPTTSLLASLYKQQSFAESRNSQAAARLPVIANSRLTNYSSKASRELKPFSNPSYSASVPSSHNQLSGRRVFPAGQKPPSRSQTERSIDNKSLSVGASESWNAVHDSILANGHGIFQETPTKPPLYSNAKTHSSDQSRNHFNRGAVNYVPFYEIRGRGDGASVVDIPSIDVEGKKIITTPAEAMYSDLKARTSTSMTKHQTFTGVNRQGTEEVLMSKKSDDQSSLKVTESNDDAPSSLVSSLLRPQKNEADKVQSPSKIEKKVRFSGTITTNKISEEPSYTETLINSMHKSFKQHNYLNTVHRTVASNLGATDFKDLDLKQGEGIQESIDASSRLTGDDEDPGFITPVMKVVVTKRETPAGAEQVDSNVNSPRDSKQQTTPLQVTLAASRLINNQSSLLERTTQSRPETRQQMTAEMIRRGTKATQRASTAGYGRRKEAIARVVKLVPKRQTVIMPNFTKQPSWTTQGRNFPNHNKSQKYGSTEVNSPAFSASVQGNSFNQQTTKEMKYKQASQSSKENLKTRLVGNGPTSQYLISKFDRTNFSKLPQEDRKKALTNEIAATPLVALPTTENVTQISLLSPRLFTDFQPIPSMPDHINFCDPRKTELILRWLEDVNKKRNIESRLRRVNLSK